MNPGIYTDMSNNDYHTAPGWSNSNLKNAEMSIAVAERRDLYSYDSPAFDLGQTVHTMVLEPETSHERIAGMPKLNLSTKVGKAAAAEFKEEHAGKLILKADDYKKARAMADSVLGIYGDILAGCQNESSVFAEDETGLLRKCRPDSLCLNRNTIFDLKHTKDDFYWFGKKAIFDFHYDMQAAWYVDTCRLAGLEINAFAFVVVSNIKPYFAFGYLATEEVLASGREKYMKVLEKIRMKHEEGKDSFFHDIILPHWRREQLELAA